MKKLIRNVILTFLIAAVVITWFILTPKDIRPPYLKKENIEDAESLGHVLLHEVQKAYGGKEHWLSFDIASYQQTADWYEDKFGTSGWDTLPQKFIMTSELGTDNSEFRLLNGQNSGQNWGVKNWNSYRLDANGDMEYEENEKYQHKLIYKNYWFQFPFRISEAPIILYAGEEAVYGKNYDLLFVTWGSEEANKDYDQYVLYIDQQTRLIEWLQFTIRDKFRFLQLTAQFADFDEINGIICPFTQYITMGKTGNQNRKIHENRYEWIQFGDIKVKR